MAATAPPFAWPETVTQKGTTPAMPKAVGCATQAILELTVSHVSTSVGLVWWAPLPLSGERLSQSALIQWPTTSLFLGVWELATSNDP